SPLTAVTNLDVDAVAWARASGAIGFNALVQTTFLVRIVRRSLRRQSMRNCPLPAFALRAGNAPKCGRKAFDQLRIQQSNQRVREALCGLTMPRLMVQAKLIESAT